MIAMGPGGGPHDPGDAPDGSQITPREREMLRKLYNVAWFEHTKDIHARITAGYKMNRLPTWL